MSNVWSFTADKGTNMNLLTSKSLIDLILMSAEESKVTVLTVPRKVFCASVVSESMFNTF